MKHPVRSTGIAVLLLASASAAWATNGMDLEGYGPVSLGMGGASMAFDNGTAAVINNPATLSLMPDGASRLDAAFGFLGPDVTASVPGMHAANSNGDAYFMPALGLATRRGDLTYGFGVFGQGGMGTRFSEKSFLALNSGDRVMSEVSVGRVIAPVSYQVTDRLSVAGTVDFIWAGMDLKMAMPAQQAMGFVRGRPTLPMPALPSSGYVRVDFADDSQFTGEARGYGADMKVGALFHVSDKVRLGAVYHAEPELGDLEADHAVLSMGDSATGQSFGSMNGKVRVQDFRWPAMLGGGIAVDASDRLLLALDVRRIFWSHTMKSMKMIFESDNGAKIKMALPQDWEDQTVFEFGLAFKASDVLTLRAGYNYGENPVPDRFVNPLFPAIVEHHITGGFGYQVADNQALNLAVSYVPENEVTNADGVTSSHSQVSGQLMYSFLF